MKTQQNIFIAFILNLCFSVFELFGGIFTRSIAIVSDSVHDIGDAVSIGISYFLERKSKKNPTVEYTYGYGRYSVLGGAFSTLILIVGSFFVIINAVIRIFNPVPINYDGMILFAVVGALVNALAAFFTREGDSLNQKAVNLHMLEDVLGWLVVLVGAIVIKLTDLMILDPLMSLGVAIFILTNAFKNLKEIICIFLEKAPENINYDEIISHLKETEGISDIHHLHIWTIDGQQVFATLHAVVDTPSAVIKERIRNELSEHGISHVTVELEEVGEECSFKNCRTDNFSHRGHHHHHH
ncbi:MAG: cation transporter [Ruminococcaceae bacterium]|nr:cation transporter [Oscillospiraceae bacterium]